MSLSARKMGVTAPGGSSVRATRTDFRGGFNPRHVRRSSRYRGRLQRAERWHSTTAPLPALGGTPNPLLARVELMRIMRLNGPQRIIIVIGMGIALYLFGNWLIGSWQGGSFGWVSYEPLSQATPPPEVILHPWVRLLIWLALTVVWAIVSLWMLSTRKSRTGMGDSAGANDEDHR
jgi:hypothetical protein